MTDPATAEAGHAVRTVWIGHLGNSAGNSTTNFFEAGGNSLLAASMITSLSQQFDVPLTLRMLTRHPTLAEFSAAVAEVVHNHRLTTGPSGRSTP